MARTEVPAKKKDEKEKPESRPASKANPYAPERVGGSWEGLVPSIPEFMKWDPERKARPIPSRDAAATAAGIAGAPPTPAPPRAASPGTGQSPRTQIQNEQLGAGMREATEKVGNTPSTASDLNNAASRKEERRTSLYGEEPGTDPRISAAVIPGSGTVLGQTERLAPRVRSEPGATWTTKPMGRGDENNPAYAAIREEAARAFPSAVGGRGRGGFIIPDPVLSEERTPFSAQLATLRSESDDPIQRLEYRAYLERRIQEERDKEAAEAQRQAGIAQAGFQTRAAEMDPRELAQIEAQGKYGGEYIKAGQEQAQVARMEEVMMPLIGLYMQAKDQGDQQKMFQLMQLILSLYGRRPPGLSNQGMMFSMVTPGGAPAAEDAG